MRHFRLRMMFSLFAVVMTVTAAFGAGPEWVQLDENGDSRFFYDKAAVSGPEKGLVQVTTRVVYTGKGKADALETLSRDKNLAKLYESRYRYELKCEPGESRLLEVAHLDKKGKTLKATELASVTEWEEVPPGVRMTLVMDEVCPSP